MYKILCLNAKGGCGKTTLATNLSTWYADEGRRVALVDHDPQKSSPDWLLARQDYEGVPAIEGLDGTRNERPPGAPTSRSATHRRAPAARN